LKAAKFLILTRQSIIIFSLMKSFYHFLSASLCAGLLLAFAHQTQAQCVITQIGNDIDGEADNDQSGKAVAISADGNTVVIGSVNNSGGGGFRGHVRMYKNNSGTWAQHLIDIDGEADSDLSGAAVALRADGNVVAVGAPFNAGGGSTRGHVRVFTPGNPSWSQLGTDIDGEADGDNSGWAVSLSADGARLAIGAPSNAGGGSTRGHVRVYQYSVPQGWTQLGNDIDGEANGDQSGRSVSMSADGSTVAIGAITNAGGGIERGHVRVYKWMNGAWTQQGSDIDGKTDHEQSGLSISLNADGTTLALSAPYNDVAGFNQGQVRVYQLVGNAWMQQGSDINGEAEADVSGYSLSLSSDGSTLAVGAIYNDAAGGNNRGHVRVYKNIGGTWTLQGTDIDGEADNDQSGWSVALNADGSKLVVGAPDNDAIGGNNRGHARVYQVCSACPSLNSAPAEVNITNSSCGSNCVLSSGIIAAPGGTPCPAGSTLQYQVNGGMWSSTLPTYDQGGAVQTIKTRCNCNSNPATNSPESAGATTAPGICGAGAWAQLGTDIDGEAPFDKSGWAVSLSADGTTMAVGAPYNAAGGHVRVYKNIGGSWVQKGGDIDGAGGEFGYSVSLSADGNTLAVGAPLSNSSPGYIEVGQARVYQFVGSSWVQQGSDINGETDFAKFGQAVSLSADGTTLAIGSPSNPGGGNARGEVEVYKFMGGAWAQLGSDIGGESNSNASGFSVAVSADGSTVAIGAPFNPGGGGTGRGHARVYRLLSGAWTQVGADMDGEANSDFSGYSVALSADGNTVAIGGPGNAGGGTIRGHVRVYLWANGAWTQQGSDIDGEADNNYLGRSVYLSADGNTLAAGAPYHDANKGHARVYKFANGTWTQYGSDIDGEANDDRFGWSVSLSADGSKVAVGAPDNDGGGDTQGHARVYQFSCPSCPTLSSAPPEVSITNSTCGSNCTLGGGSIAAPTGTPCPAGSTLQYQVNGGAWSSTLPNYTQNGPAQTVKTRCSCNSEPTMSSPESAGVSTVPGACGAAGTWSQLGMSIDGKEHYGGFGQAVSMSGDGSLVVAGAPNSSGGGVYKGSVQVYKNVGGAWTQEGSDINGESDNDYFGSAVSISSDGSTVAVGARWNNSGRGHVRIYKFVAGAWTQQGSDIDGETIGDLFGYAVSLNSDGSTVAIGAPYNDGTSGNNRGHVRVYKWVNGAWTQQGNDIDGEDELDQSGSSVSLSPDGSTVAIGAPQNSGGSLAKGHARVYRFINGAWAQQGGDIDGETDLDESGYSVSLNLDGSTVAIGAINNIGTGGTKRGHVRVYQLTGGSWTQQGGDIDGKEAHSVAGTAVSLSSDGKTVAVGAPSASMAFGGNNTKSQVYVYKFVNGAWTQQGSDIDGEVNGDRTGYALSLSSDGSTVAIGAFTHPGGGADRGRVRVFKTNSCSSCPNFTSAPPEVSITNSTCGLGCSHAGGDITAPSGTPCPTGSTLQYQVNGGAWSSTLPTYAQSGPAQTIKTRCNCDSDQTTSSAESAGVTTVPSTIANPVVPTDGIATVACVALATPPPPPPVTGCDGSPIVPTGPAVVNAFDAANCEGTRTYTYFYACGGTSSAWNFQYTVERQPFVLPADGAAIVGCPADAFLPTPPVVQSNCGETLTPTGPTVTDSPIPLAINGTRTYAWTYTDCEGNQATWRFVYTIQTPAPPSIICPANIVRGTDPNQCTAQVSYNPPFSSVNCGTAILTLTSPPNTASGSIFPKGVTMVAWEASNGSGQTAVCNFTVTINDTQQPSIACPTNIVRSTDANLCTAVVTYATPTSTDNCAPAPTVMHMSGGMSGTAFPKGITVVQWKSTDGSNLTNTCTFTVTVNDVVLPNLVCPTNITRNTDAGQCHAAVTYTPPTYSDNCAGGSATIQSGLPSGSDFPKGINTVVWKATDAGGLTKTCTFRVTVNDAGNPTITCPTVAPTTAANSCASTTVTYPTPTATDNCPGSVTVARLSGPASGSNFPLGTTTVIWRAIDGAGRSSTCSFAVVVIDGTSPNITCPNNVLVMGSGNPCSAVAGYTTPTATDNCGIQSLFLLSGQPSGSTYPAGATVNTWRAVDNGGNSATCSFTVTVGCGPAPSGMMNNELGMMNQHDTHHSSFTIHHLSLNLMPNPATSEVRVSIENLGAMGGELLVFDPLGRVLLRRTLAAEQPTIELSLNSAEFPNGLYQVTLRTESHVLSKPLIVSRL